ncbi:MAG: hypothetical protein ACP5HG_05135 [Anaerolineae bacterium]
MPKRSIQLLPPQRSQQLTALADRARFSLSQYAGVEVDYNAVGLQTLDEWIERHLRQFPRPSSEIRTVWGTFLGETFRRRYQGQWAIENSRGRPRLGIVCSKGKDLVFIDVMDQVSRRIQRGMNESLAFYYTIRGVELQSI